MLPLIEYEVYYLDPVTHHHVAVLKTTIMEKAFDRARETAHKINRLVAIRALDLSGCGLRFSFVYPDGHIE